MKLFFQKIVVGLICLMIFEVSASIIQKRALFSDNFLDKVAVIVSVVILLILFNKLKINFTSKHKQD